MKILFISNLYPNSQEPAWAPFNRQKIAHLSKYCQITVVAPIRWFPFKSLFCKWMDKIPFREMIDGLEVYHPKVFYTPGLLRFLYGIFYYLSIRAFIRGLCRRNNFDVVYSSWIYPDGYAAMKLAEELHKPFQAEALGSDINIHLGSDLPRKMILEALQKACRVTVVSNDLKKKITECGIPEEKISVIYNGINHSIFCPMDRNAARGELGLPGKEKIVLFAGNLVKIKGIKYLLQAIKSMEYPGLKLYMIGMGSLENSLKRMIEHLGLQGAVVMAGACPHKQMPLWMNASDLLCVPSIMEGRPNVILEALACGIPVVASGVGGIPELITDDKVGILANAADAVSLKAAIEKALSVSWDRDYITKTVSSLSWEDNAAKRYECLKSCLI